MGHIIHEACQKKGLSARHLMLFLKAAAVVVTDAIIDD